MSFARAWSNRREKAKTESLCVGRAAVQRGGRPILRTQISSPMALVSTSNVHVYTAQVIAGTRPIEIRQVSDSTIDTSSSDESDTSFSSSVQSAGTLTDASSIDDSPTTSPSLNQFTSLLKPTMISTTRSRSYTDSSTESNDPDVTPRIPQRAPSHSKKAHERIHRKKSLERSLMPPSAIKDVPRDSIDFFSGNTSTKQQTLKELLPPLSFENSPKTGRSSFDIISDFRPKTATITQVSSPVERTSPVSPLSTLDSPFGDEIAQLQEVADGFGNAVRDAEEDADVLYMEKHGFATFSAAEYMFEIQSLVHNMFSDEQPFFKHLGGFF